MTILFYNPNSGNGTFSGRLDEVIAAFQRNGKVLLPHRLGDDRVTDAFIQSISWQLVAKIIIAGGDGTIHKMINLLMAAGVEKPIAIFPVGTANDFSQMFQIPLHFEEMIDIALDDYYTPCDVGCVNGRYFVNVASFGNLVEVGQKVNPQVKNTLGVLAYYIKGIEELPKLKPVPIRFVTEQHTFEGKIFFALIMNGKSAGGFRKLAPYSDVQDGRFDILIFKQCPLIEIMPLLIKVWNGEHPKSPYIEYFQASHIEVSAENLISSDLDGEPGPHFPLHIEILHKKLQINVKKN
ncbi:MAG: hypothetical protein PWP51_571 [Clostridiales bacterium]|jgi:YegS/Rv2252/BmrU family lipid kinase|nr:hypothetical protein [Clostridiales bacterium]MDN5298018.1 hypothetical protein [Clostridiales bacterium]